MTKRREVVYTPHAADAIERAVAWWRMNRDKAPNALEDDLEIALDLIAREPRAGIHARNIRLRDVRRVLLKRVRYNLFYRLDAATERIEILDLWHMSHGSGPDL